MYKQRRYLKWRAETDEAQTSEQLLRSTSPYGPTAGADGINPQQVPVHSTIILTRLYNTAYDGWWSFLIPMGEKKATVDSL